MIPVLLEECTAPPTLRNLAYIDMRDDDRISRNYTKLLEALLGISPLRTEAVDWASSRHSPSRLFDIDPSALKWNLSLVEQGQCTSYENTDLLMEKVVRRGERSIVFVRGLAGVGKSTLLKCANDYLIGQKRRVRFLEMHNSSAIDQVVYGATNRVSNSDDSLKEVFLLDGLEDYGGAVDFEEKHRLIKRLVSRISELHGIILVTVRSVVFDDVIGDRSCNDYRIVDIFPWENNQLNDYLSLSGIAAPPKELYDILRVPFYARIYCDAASAGGGNTFHTPYDLIDSFVAQEVMKISRANYVNKLLLYEFLVATAWRMRRKSVLALSEFELLDICAQEIGDACASELLSLFVRRGSGFGFFHDLIAEYLVAASVIRDLYRNRQQCLSEFQTSYQEDMFIASQIKNDGPVVSTLLKESEQSHSSTYSVNIVGILAKTNTPANLEILVDYLRNNKGVYEKYRRAVVNRLTTGSSRVDPDDKSQLAHEEIEKRMLDEIREGRDPLAAIICISELDSDSIGHASQAFKERYGFVP